MYSRHSRTPNWIVGLAIVTLTRNPVQAHIIEREKRLANSLREKV